MSNIVGLINYGIAGNIHSIKKAIEKAGGVMAIVNTPQELDGVDKIVIPGVGSFNDAMRELANDGLIEPLKKLSNQNRLWEFVLVCRYYRQSVLSTGRQADLML